MDQNLRYFYEALGLKEHDLTDFSPLKLAYLGDAVYELIIRSYVLDVDNAPVEKMHRHTTKIVRAAAQAAAYHAIEEKLTPEEQSAYRRGRNARSYSRAKNASLSEYRVATGFEALFGWLFLTEQFERMSKLTALSLQGIGELPDPGASDGTKEGQN